MKEWWTLAELAASKLAACPGTAQGWHLKSRGEGWATRTSPTGEPLARKRQGKGGGWEYHVSLLPEKAQIELTRRERLAAQRAAREADAQDEADAAAAWAEHEKRGATARAEADRRIRVMMRVETLMMREGLTRKAAIAIVLPEEGVARATYFDWLKLVRGKLRMDWLPALAPRWKAVNAGKTTASFSPEAWEAIKTDYLRLEGPSLRSVYDRVVEKGKALGWSVPGYKTVLRRIEREIPPPLLTYLRKGEKALARTYPAQERSRAHFHALQGINADGHVADNWVRWPDGEVSRLVIILIQDLYSNKLLARRIDKSESTAAIRLTFYDVFRDWGISDFATLDNGRAFASKQMTGGQPTRYRYKVTKDEMDGCLTGLGMSVHWTNPYSGQSKPIERAFRDFADRGAKHPALAGSYAGNCPDNKPDYPKGVTPVPLDVFMAVFDAWMAEYNARPGRRTEVANGRSFDEVFGESYAASPIRKATAEQLRFAMLAAQRVTARAPDGSIRVLGNRYWGEFLSCHIGKRVTVRFDPDDLGAPVWVYGVDGTYLGEAECWEAVGFDNVAAAKEHARNRRAYLRHVKAAAAHERSMSAEELLALDAAVPALPVLPPPEARVVRMVSRRGGAALAVRDEPQEAPAMERQREYFRLLDVALDRSGK